MTYIGARKQASQTDSYILLPDTIIQLRPVTSQGPRKARTRAAQGWVEMKANLKAPNYTTLSLSEPWTCHWRNIPDQMGLLTKTRAPAQQQGMELPCFVGKVGTDRMRAD